MACLLVSCIRRQLTGIVTPVALQHRVTARMPCATFVLRASQLHTHGHGDAERGPARKSLQPPRVLISEFKHVLPLVKRLVLRMHPDVVTSFGAEVVAANEAALQDLFRLLDTVKQHCRDESVPHGMPQSAAGRAAPLSPRYTFAFFYRAPGTRPDTQRRDLTRASVDARAPPLLEERTAVFAARGFNAEAKALWLEFVLTVLRKLLIAVGLSAEARSLSLAPSLADAIVRANRNTAGGHSSSVTNSSSGAGAGESARAPPRFGSPPDSAIDALRDNLLSMSPLEQGKGSPSPYQDATAPRASVFPLAARRARALEVVGTRVLPAPGLPDAHVRAAFDALRAAFTVHHDALQLYHSVWQALSIVVGPPGSECSAEPVSLVMRLPADLNAAGLVAFVRGALPAMIVKARQGVAPRAAAARRNASRRGAPVDGWAVATEAAASAHRSGKQKGS